MEDTDTFDLFTNWDLIPENVNAILEKYSFSNYSYINCENLKNDLNKVGYTIDYGLDAEPYNLRKL